jgi:hypothetical protein
MPTTGLVEVDPSFTVGAGPLVGDGAALANQSGVPLLSFVLTNNGSGTMTVFGVTATARLGLNSIVTSGDTGTSGDEEVELVRACVVDATTPGTPLGCGTFDADNGRLLVLLTTPLTLSPASQRTLGIVYDLSVQPSGTLVVTQGAEAPTTMTCPAPAALDALTASESLPPGDAIFSLRPLEPGDIIALRPNPAPGTLDDQPVVPVGTAVTGRTVMVKR